MGLPNPTVYTYDPKQLSLICGGKIIHGFADGTSIEVERNSQAFNLKIGVDGEGTRAKSNDRSAKITIHLMQSSSSNDDLSAFAAADELSNTGVFPVVAKDGSGRSLFASITAWVQKYPKADFARETSERVWVIETNDMDFLVAGN